MFSIIITILVILLVGAVLYWAATRIMAAFSIGDPIRTVVLVIIIILVLLFVVRASGLVAL